MAIGERIRFFRKRKGYTQKQFGELLGFLGKTSDVRITQYESEVRVPKEDLVREMAGQLGVSPRAITVPDIDTDIGLMHTFFTLEDKYGLHPDMLDGEIVLRLDKNGPEFPSMFDKFRAWYLEWQKTKSGESDAETAKAREVYDEWRYTYPDKDTHQNWTSVMSIELSDHLKNGLKSEKEKKRKK